jgi:twitching motility protein PilI
MARKNASSLREFQARLTERLKLAATQRTSSAHLGIEIGDTRYLVELADAGEIVPVPTVTSVPLTQEWFRGVVNLRGMLYSVTDLARFLGIGATQIDRDARLLAIGSRFNFNAAILVSRMLGLRSIEKMQRIEGDGAHAALGAKYQDDSGQVWTELRLSALAADERFLLVGR